MLKKKLKYFCSILTILALFTMASCSMQDSGSMDTVSNQRAATSGSIFVEAEAYSAMSGIQTQACSEGTDNVGWTDVGDWMDYTINVPTSGEYTVNYRVASPVTSGQVQLKVGSSVLATTSITNTGGWQNWATQSATVNLNSGNQTVRLYVSGQLFNINWFELVGQSSGAFGKIEAEDYSAMSGIQTQACSEGTDNVGWTDMGDWMDYTIDVPSAGQYTVSYRVASPINTSKLQMKLGSNVLATTSVPNTGGWQNWTTVTASVNLSSGNQTIRLYVSGTGFNINWFEFSQGSVVQDGVTISGRQILVDGSPFQIKGVCWNPIGIGGTHPSGINYTGYVEQDASLMQAAGINAIRTYEAITDTAVLDVLYAHGIYVINTVYSWGPKDPYQVVAEVNMVKDHPAILMWSLGNEWNYNGLYVGMSFNESVAAINNVASLIKAADPNHPIASVYGVWGDNLPPGYIIDDMPNIDVWGINTYSGLNFGNIMNLWSGQSSKPMFIAEYGADAWNANISNEDGNAQGYAVKVLTQLLLNNSSAANASAVCSGGTIFEWADEWWKDGEGSAWVQDIGGVAPGGGPYPDYVFNEEYWGIVDIYRNPRPAYYELKNLYN